MGEVHVDVLIFGASGFTGKHVVREFLKFTDLPNGLQRTVGIAGRNKAKLCNTLEWALEGAKPPTPVQIFVADVENPDSLLAVCKKTRLVLNCAGPYRKYGEPVVVACLEAGADYLDLSGEPEFMEAMEAKYYEEAQKRGTLVVSACGYDSIPAELGVIFNSREFVNSSAQPHSVNSYILTENKKGPVRGNTGTWESVVLGVSNQSELRKMRRSWPRLPKFEVPGAPAKKPSLIHWEEHSRSWALILPSCDASVVRRTLARIAQYPSGLPALEDEDHPEAVEVRKKKLGTIRPVYYGVYLSIKNSLLLVAVIVVALVLGFFTRFSWTRSLLVKYPEIFSGGIFTKKGPKAEDLKNTTFQMWFVGKGYTEKVAASKAPNKEIVTRISGPEIGYIATSIIIVQAALVVLDQRRSLPKGGVLTPGFVFGTTDLQQRLEQNGFSFDVVSTRPI